jgi:hypothetical protein
MARTGPSNKTTSQGGVGRNDDGPSTYPPPGTNLGDEDDAINSRMRTMGFVSDDFMNRFTQAMQEAVVSGIKQAEGAGQTGRSAQRGKTRHTRYDPTRPPATGPKGLLSTIAIAMGSRLVTGPGPFNTPRTSGAPPTAARAGGGSGGYRGGGIPGSPPPPAPPPQTPAPPGGPPEPEEQGPWQQGGGRVWTGYTNAPPEAAVAAPGAAEGAATTAVGTEVSAAQAATTTGTAERMAAAATGGGLRNAVGQALLGYGNEGLGGAWKGLTGALPDALGVLGPVGIGLTALTGAYEGANMIGNAIAGQRQQGAYYQSILGGTNWGGQQQRMAQMGYRFSQIGNLSGAQANALFQGVTGLDMTGAQRTNAMQQAVQMYDQLGVSIQSSLQNITIAAQSGNKELNNLAQSINTVTQAASAGGMNANVARQNFTNLYGAATQVVQGPGATTAAGAFATAQAQGGQLIQGANTSGFLSQQALQLYAAQNRMSYGQVVAGIQQGTLNVGTLAQNSVLQQLTNSGAMNNISKAIDQLPDIKATVNAHKQLSDDQIESVVTQMASNGDSADFYNLPQILDTLYPGNNFSSTSAIDFAVMAASGRWDPSQALQKIQTKWQQQSFKVPTVVSPAKAVAAAQAAGIAPKTEAQKKEEQYRRNMQESYLRQQIQVQHPDLSVAQRQTMLNTEMADWEKTQTAQQGAAYSKQLTQTQFYQSATDTKQYQQAARAVGMPGTMSKTWEDVFGTTQSNQAREWYMKNIVQKGTRDPVIEAMLKSPELNNPNTVFSVYTGAGSHVLATAEELEKNPSYLKAAQAGQVTVASSNTPGLQGTSLASFLGFQAASKQVVATPTGGRGAAAEQTKLQNMVNRDQKNIITVQPSPTLLKWMQFNSNSGNVTIDNQTATNQTQAQYTLPTLPNT